MSKYKKKAKRKVIIKYEFVDSLETQTRLHGAFRILFEEVIHRRGRIEQNDTKGYD